MNERDINNTFRFSLHQGDVLLGEKCFDADNFNPITRYSINIRHILPKIITKLQKTLSKRNYDTNINNGFDLFVYNKKLINSYPVKMRDELRYNPQSIVQHIDGKIIKGVECKIGFYINDKPIVERLFYVDGYNIVARWSVDLVDEVMAAANIINAYIKQSDITNMWDDYDLINIKGMTITQIRDLSSAKREEMLRKIRK